MRVNEFWMGAHEVAKRVPLAGLVAATVGWERMRSGGEAVWREVGIPGELCSTWAAGEAYDTRGTALTLMDAAYPRALRELPDAPPVLFVEGAVDVLQQRGLGVVGTRRATTYGRQVAREIGRQAGAAGLLVVSGLARGIDGEAHSGALCSGTTAAVLAHGLAHTAPGSHRPLRRAILAGGGVMLTAHLDHEPPRPWTFPIRNRWIAGLSSAIVVVEAPVKSGALHTVRAAADYGREVFAVPGLISSPSSGGCNQLLADGATPVVSVPGLLDDLGLGGPDEAPSWLDEVVAGASLMDVAARRGLSLEGLLGELEMMEATGEVVRLAGHRYVRG